MWRFDNIRMTESKGDTESATIVARVARVARQPRNDLFDSTDVLHLVVLHIFSG